MGGCTMGEGLIDVKTAKEYVQANYQGDPLLRHLYMTLLDALPRVKPAEEAPRSVRFYEDKEESGLLEEE